MAWLPYSRVKKIDAEIDKLYKIIDVGCRYPSVSLVTIVRKCGLEVYTRDFGAHSGNDVMGVIDFKDNKSKPVIYINKYNHPNNQKFTLAHELGHYILGHRDRDVQFRIDFESDIYPRDSELQQQELEANYFAGALLMPAQAIKQQLNRDDLSQKITAEEMKRLKDYFGVSELALKTRINWLKRAQQ